MKSEQIHVGGTYKNKKGHLRTVVKLGRIGNLGSNMVSYIRSQCAENGPNYTELTTFARWAKCEIHCGN